MPQSESRELILLLRDIESRSRQHAAGFPQQGELRQFWEGLLFSVAGMRVVTPLNEVKEVLKFPSVITPVPGVLPWVHGVANIRGNLLPIIDLQCYLNGKDIVMGRRTQILVINHSGLFAGLMVGDVMGMRHFPEESRVDTPLPKGLIGDYMRGAFELEGERWPLFSMRALAESPLFQVVVA